MIDFGKLTHQLNSARVTMYLTIPAPCGWGKVFIDAHDLEQVLKDRDAFIAKRFGVTKGHYLRWVEFIRYPQCMAITRQRRQCQNCVAGAEREFDEPNKFDPNRAYFCHSHQQYAQVFQGCGRAA